VPLLNQALGCDFPPGTPDYAVNQEIASVKGFFAGRDLPWYWWIGPQSSPDDIARRLERHGAQPDPPPLPAMIAPLPSPASPPPATVRDPKPVALCPWIAE